MNYQVYEFQEIIEQAIAWRRRPTVFVRNIGPRAIADETRRDEVYNTYRMLLGSDVMQGLLRNEYIFISFDDLETAREYAVDNFPRNSEGDSDMYMQVEVYDNEGRIEYHNR